MDSQSKIANLLFNMCILVNYTNLLHPTTTNSKLLYVEGGKRINARNNNRVGQKKKIIQIDQNDQKWKKDKIGQNSQIICLGAYQY